MTTIIGISGSARKGSYNRALLQAATMVTPKGCVLELASIENIPLYNGDLEVAEGIPESVSTLKDQIAAADGLLIATPEYNNSVPGVLKNAVDWLSRPPADIPRVFRNRAVAITGATPGGAGTRMAQTAWLPIFRALGMHAWFGAQLYVSGAHKVFDESGNIVDESIKERLQSYIAGFVEFATAARL
ncbi:MAG: NADPH-dependent FMN reductase [Acidiferrobacterales bacterium]